VTIKKAKTENSSTQIRGLRPALTPEGRELQLVSLAVDLAEKQLLEGTASSQVITHYLKLGTTRERLEREKLEKENELLIAKTDAIKSQADQKEIYEEALKAMRIYSGNANDEDYDL
jgi:hypothetical protein